MRVRSFWGFCDRPPPPRATSSRTPDRVRGMLDPGSLETLHTLIRRCFWVSKSLEGCSTRPTVAFLAIACRIAQYTLLLILTENANSQKLIRLLPHSAYLRHLRECSVLDIAPSNVMRNVLYMMRHRNNPLRLRISFEKKFLFLRS